MSISRNFKELFENPDNKSEQWENDFINYVKTENTQELLDFIRNTELYEVESEIFSAVAQFTKNTVSNDKKYKLLKSLEDESFVDKVDITDSIIHIKTKKGVIAVRPLTSFLTFLKNDPDIETDSRIGKCHEKSMAISQILGSSNEVVTGYICGLSNKQKYLHSWVEVKLADNYPVVIDYTINAVMNRDGYYLLKHPKILNRVSNEDIKNDQKYILSFSETVQSINIKEYLVFRDEIMRDINKNKLLFDEEER